MNRLRIHGILFCVLSCLLTLAASTVLALGERAEVTVLASLIFLLGVPHGALDPIFAHRLYRVRSWSEWIVFTFAYLALAGLTVLLWKFAPLIFLAGFLSIALFHFSGDPEKGTPPLCRLVFGGAIIILPALRHGSEQLRLLTYLGGNLAGATVGSVLHMLSVPWLVMVAAVVIVDWRRDWLASVEITAVTLLALFMPPLAGFTVYFCGMHSSRHILRTIGYAGRKSLFNLVAAATAPMLGSAALFGIAFFWFRDLAFEASVIQVIFVVLAALTVPHMALVERVRFAGWESSSQMSSQLER